MILTKNHSIDKHLAKLGVINDHLGTVLVTGAQLVNEVKELEHDV